ncbi:hypothetical protein [Streptomyces sp. Inha503]|uniref:hypothetical protein n=1 Tax=Streptomyces sp. Inha503 TaxID=3383314 RepID=UPI00399F22C8
MAVQVCSLITDTPQLIPVGGYHVVRFPYGSAESYDAHGMHQVVQPDGSEVTDWRTDDRAGLIWPSADGWGSLTAMIQWAPGDYTELRDRFVRDPLGEPDSTATDHRPPSPGMQCFTKHHEIFVYHDVPLSVMVAHTSDQACELVFAEFKLAIHST